MTGMRIDTEPRISREGFAQVLRDNWSDAGHVGGECYDAILAYGLDPAIGLAFFQHESGFGEFGAAARSCNWGNIRKGGTWLDHHDGHNGAWLVYRRRPDEGPQGHWIRSAADWAQLMNDLYIYRWGLNTVEVALQRYAPAPDDNDPYSYAACVVRSVTGWAEQYPPVEPEPPGPTLEDRVEVLELGLESVCECLEGLIRDLEGDDE